MWWWCSHCKNIFCSWMLCLPSRFQHWVRLGLIVSWMWKMCIVYIRVQRRSNTAWHYCISNPPAGKRSLKKSSQQSWNHGKRCCEKFLCLQGHYVGKLEFKIHSVHNFLAKEHLKTWTYLVLVTMPTLGA